MAVACTRRFVVIFLVVLCLGFAVPAAAIDNHAEPGPPSADAMAVDFALVRPVSLVATIVGTGIFIVSLPFSLLGGNVAEADKQLVVKPLAYTFARPLGDFHDVSLEPLKR